MQKEEKMYTKDKKLYTILWYNTIKEGAENEENRSNSFANFINDPTCSCGGLLRGRGFLQ